MKPLIEAHALTKRYRDGIDTREIVSNVEFALKEGEFVALRGASGSGKTTLLALLGGMVQPTSGEVIVAGNNLTTLRDHHRVRARRRLVGFVFQELGLIPNMTVLENILLPLVPDGGPTSADTARAHALLDRFQIAPHAKKEVRKLSGGEKQRAAIARALILNPRVLLLDEPTAHIDAALGRELMTTLKTLTEEGASIVIATHDPAVFSDACVHRTMEMHAGKLNQTSSPTREF